ncbi:4-hydroxythreonine-4-phosphate dehydrogenase PdxA [Pelagibacteraceae bacterium]|nr:4-hydroxythreonine-4-phosphate dehydrogenase PdxA [Pelagibacteraceae bacterium]
MKKKIIIVGGDPNSINSELIYKSWKKLDKSLRNRIYIISSYSLLKAQFKKLKYKIKLKKIKDIHKKNLENELKIIDVNLRFKNPFKIPYKSSSNFILNSLNFGHKLALKKEIAGFINCAIDKKLLVKSKIGVTEYLASKCKIKNNSEVMLIKNDKLAVCPITTHINIREISGKIKKELIITKVKTIDNWYKKKLKKNPKIAILGLNPHNAEMRKDSEEKKIIIPAIKKLRRLGLNIKGPLVSDTIFINDYKKFDVIIGMFHDQVLTPFKTLYKFNAINITLGLKYLRVSPDHGVAVDIIGKKRANYASLLNCIKFINKFGK